MSHSVLHPVLYTPATTEVHKQLDLVNRNRKEVPVWTMVLCTEDAIREADVPQALDTLRAVLAGKDPNSGVAVYVRVRNADVLKRLLDLPNVDRLRGFVIPKADPATFPSYADQLAGTDFRLMPILESPLMMDHHFRETLRMVLLSDGYRSMIDCLRIGGNDLMGHLGIRRDDREFTIYDTPVGQTIHAIINEFRGLAGFFVSAPVFECFGTKYDGLLRKEVEHHIMNGLFGQTVIHTRHLRPIRDLYKVSQCDLESARAIVGDDTAVSGRDGKMDERNPHLKWAELILERHRLFQDDLTSMTLADVLR